MTTQTRERQRGEDVTSGVHAKTENRKKAAKMFFLLQSATALFPISAPALNGVPTHTITRTGPPSNTHSRVVAGWLVGAGGGGGTHSMVTASHGPGTFFPQHEWQGIVWMRRSDCWQGRTLC